MARNPWPSLAFDTWMLALDSSLVINRRLAKLALMDGPAFAEAQLMVAEKVEAMAALQFKAVTGGLGTKPETGAKRTIAHYRKAVRKNRKRLR